MGSGLHVIILGGKNKNVFRALPNLRVGSGLRHFIATRRRTATHN